MAVEFPSRVSFFFGSTEKMFKEYVHDACAERGYSNREPWTVYNAYGFGNSMSGNLDSHVGQIYEKMKENLSGYSATKRWANRAADAICPPKNSGGGGGSMPPVSGSGEMRRRITTIRSMLPVQRPVEQQLGALMMFNMQTYQNGTCVMMGMQSLRIFAPPMPMMLR